MVPVLPTAIVMLSGFVVVGMFTARGRSTFTVFVITGIVMRKMMRRTSMTSTSGVVLIVAITDGPSSSDGEPTFIAIVPFLSDFVAVSRACARPLTRNYLRSAAAGAATGRV